MITINIIALLQPVIMKMTMRLSHHQYKQALIKNNMAVINNNAAMLYCCEL